MKKTQWSRKKGEWVNKAYPGISINEATATLTGDGELKHFISYHAAMDHVEQNIAATTVTVRRCFSSVNLVTI